MGGKLEHGGLGLVWYTGCMVIRPSLTYASITWWPKTLQSNTKHKLGKVQRLAWLGITGTIRTILKVTI